MLNNNDFYVLKNIINVIKNVKGENIVLLDINNKIETIYDYIIICNGNSRNHVYSICRSIEKFLNKKNLNIEGKKNAKWILIDYMYIIIHIFQPYEREFYKLEYFWSDYAQSYLSF
ncbi:MAG: ribosome silencing factor [Candidatus Bostrichicola ureolyticus]|nr:MAG: ribosome silencing factor [Candidatus Bostrichicola ureolyticus]